MNKEKSNYTQTRRFADSKDEQMIKIVEMHLIWEHNTINVDIQIADEYKDTKECTDLIATIDNKQYDIAMRVRNKKYKYRDLTIRTQTNAHGITEIDKLLAGYGKYYIYGWENNAGIIDEFIIVDIDKMRPLLKKKNKAKWYKSNPDGTGFLPLDIEELEMYDAILYKKLKG